jgi:hypothetical protein
MYTCVVDFSTGPEGLRQALAELQCTGEFPEPEAMEMVRIIRLPRSYLVARSSIAPVESGPGGAWRVVVLVSPAVGVGSLRHWVRATGGAGRTVGQIVGETDFIVVERIQSSYSTDTIPFPYGESGPLYNICVPEAD